MSFEILEVSTRFRLVPVRFLGEECEHQAAAATTPRMSVSAYDFLGFEDLAVLKPHRFIDLGDIRGPRPYELTELRPTIILQKPVP